MTTPAEAKRLAWVSALSELTCPGRKFPREDQMLFAKMLADYPADAFTEASLQDVACELMQFPGIKLLRERLGAWWQQHRPPVPAIAGATISDRPWLRRTGETFEEYVDRRMVELPLTTRAE